MRIIENFKIFKFDEFMTFHRSGGENLERLNEERRIFRNSNITNSKITESVIKNFIFNTSINRIYQFGEKFLILTRKIYLNNDQS